MDAATTLLEDARLSDVLSHELLRGLVEHTPDVVLIVDRGGAIQYVNHTFDGLSVEDMLGTNVVDHVLPEARERYLAAIERAFEERLPDQFDVTSIGNTRWQIRTVPLLDRDQRVDRVLVVGIDRTAIANADQALRNSEIELDAVFAAAPVAMCVIDPEGRLVRCNRRFEEFYGYTSGDLATLTLGDLTYREDAASTWNAFRILLNGGEERVAWSVRLQRKDGSIEYSEVTASAIRDDRGGLRFVVGTIAPLSAGEQFKRQLAEQSARLGEAQAIAQVGSFHWNILTDTLVWSDELHRIFGIAPQDFRGQADAYFERVHPAHRSDVERIVRHVVAEGGRVSFDYRIVRPDGEVRWVLSRCRMIRDAHGESIAMEGTCQDITDRKRAEEKVRSISEFYEAIIHNAAEGICVYHAVAEHPFLRFTVWNDEMTRITGYTLMEINRLGWHECAFPDPDQRRAAIERTLRAQRGEHLRSETWEITRKDGAKRILAISTSSIAPEDGEMATAAMMYDVTDRVLADRAVRESETRFAQFVEAIPQIIWMTSADNKRHYFVNAAYEQIMGLSARDLLANPLSWLEIVHPADRDRVSRHLTEPSEEVAVEEFRIVRRDGSERWLHNRVIPILNDQGDVYMHVGLSEDITEHKRSEDKLARQQAQLAKVSRFNILGEMVASISHEITQPLTAIANFAGASAAILENTKVGFSELKEYIEEIRAQSTRAGRIVHGLRSLARRTAPQRESCDLNELIRDALTLLRSDLRQARVEAQLDLDAQSPAVDIDRVQIQQVIVNLVRNACDALQAIPTHRVIILRTRRFDSWIEFECEDNGPGLPSSHEHRLFRAFVTTKPDGMGMGLAICRTIVEAHGGRIEARNNAGQGATIFLTLPLHLAKVEEGENQDD